MRGNLKTYHVHFQTPRGLGADLVFNREAPSARGGGGSGIVYFDPSLTRYIGWFIALPSAKVEGYFDLQWSNAQCTWRRIS